MQVQNKERGYSRTKEGRHEYYLKVRESQLAKSKQRYFEKKDILLEYQKEYRKNNRAVLNQKTKHKRLMRLLEAIELLGGKCNRCLQVFDPVCYDFHHLNPDEKDFTIGENMLLAKDKIMNEVKKCILLCSNCHRLTHKELQDAA